MQRFFLLLLAGLCLSLAGQAQRLRLEEHKLALSNPVSYRGLHMLNDELAWVSGPDGSVYRTTDAGLSWQQLPAPPADSLDYRTLWAFDEQTAIIGSAGQPAILYRTEDAGQHWQAVYADTTGQAFFDALAFADEQNGLVMSDPVKGSFFLLKTTDGGKSWQPVPAENIPAAAEAEAGFAASNSGLQWLSGNEALFATGGSQVRVLSTTDGGNSWTSTATPMVANSPARGIYSLAVNPEGVGVAVGGDYSQPEETENHLLITTDSGKSWQRLDNTGLRGYRSGVAYVPGTEATFVAVGTSGMDITTNGGKSWQPLSDLSLNAIRFSPSGKLGWAVGPKGNLVQIRIE